MENMTIGQRIAWKRKELGLSQIALGEMMGVSRQSISKWEADAAIPEIDKLIALSRLFRVSVGWLLGVEEEPRSDEPEEEVAEREQLLIEQLTQPRPVLPRWVKPTIVVSLVLSVLALILGGLAWYKAESYKKDAAMLSQTLSQTVALLPEAGKLITSDVLESYDFSITPGESMDRFDFRFAACPGIYNETDKAELLIMHDGEEIVRQECLWSGSSYQTDFQLEARSGYTAFFHLTSANGFVRSVPLYDSCIANLLGNTTFRDVRVKYEDTAYQNGVLTFYNMRFIIDLPGVYRNLTDPWTKCDLVVLADGKEVGRLDILNRSQYSRQVNFMDPEFVDFTSQQQSITIGELTDGQSVELRLEGGFTTGLTLEQTIQTWTVRQGKLSTR